MSLRISLLFFTFFIFSKTSNAQLAHELLRKGDALYKEKKYEEAQKAYQKAKEQNYNKATQSAYNLGNTYYQQGYFDKAAKEFSESSAYLGTSIQQSQGFYNEGNVFFQQKKYKESIEAYKKSLRLNADDIAAKKNLALAKKQLEQEQQQNKKQKEDSKENQPQNQPQNDKKEQPKKEEKNKKQEPKQNAQEQQQKQQQKEQLLKIIAEEERKVHQRLNGQKKQPSTKSNGKDW
jgi:Ca-activated chloride channel homolog